MARSIKVLKPGPEPDAQAQFDMVDPSRVLWMRPAFAHEVANATKLEFAGAPLYAREAVATLKAKALAEQVVFVPFQAPIGSITMEVNKGAVVNIEAPVPTRDPREAGSSLYFGGKRLAVRESVAEARAILGAT
jgi:hypothetical protein